METIEYPQVVVQELLQDFANRFSSGLKAHPVFDTQRNHYQVLLKGWQGNKFIFTCLIHIDIVDDRIVIQRNITDTELKPLLIDKGIVPHKIEIGFIPAFAES
jgi:XisI protein